MRFWLALTLFLTLVACAPKPSIDDAASGLNPAQFLNKSDEQTANASEKIVKSPHGYVINGPKERFGGFVGDCASDENFPYYWQCQSENAGRDFH